MQVWGSPDLFVINSHFVKAGKSMIKLIVSDIDGTLVDSQGTVITSHDYGSPSGGGPGCPNGVSVSTFA
jgi:hypothetical protein